MKPLHQALTTAGLLLNPALYFPLLAGYFVAMWFLRLWLFPAGSADDAEVLFFAQSFELGGKPGQPPLYTWIVQAAERIFGVSLGLVVAVKYALLFLTHVLAYALARQLTNSERWGVFAAIGLFGLYYLAWDAILNYSQTVLIGALAFAGVLAARALVRHGTLRAALAFGLVVGVGIMTKYNFALFAVALTGAVLLDPKGRDALFGRRGLAALAVAVAVALPHLIWLADGAVDGDQLARAVPDMATTGGPAFTWAAFWQARFSGLLDVLEAIASILLPFLAIWLVFFPQAARRIGPAAGADTVDDLRLMARIFGLFILLVLILVVIAGMAEVRNHWFIVLAPLVAYATLRTATVYGDGFGTRSRGYCAVLIVAACISMLGLPVRAIVKQANCDECATVTPYADIAAAMREAGFRRGTVYSVDVPSYVGGNLRPYFPDSRFESDVFNYYVPPDNTVPGQCISVWLLETNISPKPQGILNRLSDRYGADVSGRLGSVQYFDLDVGNDDRLPFGLFLLEEQAAQGGCR